MQEQELSVNDILNSIKQILSGKIEDELAQKSKSDSLSNLVNSDEKPILQRDSTPVLSDEEDNDDDVFVLTPAMQVEVDPNMAALIVEKPSVQASTFSTERPQEIIMPAVQKWIDENLPQMVERIVSEEVRRIFNTRK